MIQTGRQMSSTTADGHTDGWTDKQTRVQHYIIKSCSCCQAMWKHPWYLSVATSSICCQGCWKLNTPGISHTAKTDGLTNGQIDRLAYRLEYSPIIINVLSDSKEKCVHDIYLWLQYEEMQTDRQTHNVIQTSRQTHSSISLKVTSVVTHVKSKVRNLQSDSCYTFFPLITFLPLNCLFNVNLQKALAVLRCWRGRGSLVAWSQVYNYMYKYKYHKMCLTDFLTKSEV